MSFWIYKKDKNGRTNIFTVEVPFMAILALVGIIASLLLPPLSTNPAQIFYIIFTIGFLLVLTAKISLFRRGIWCSWGWGLMEKPYRTIYGIGYLFILFGILLLLPLLN